MIVLAHRGLRTRGPENSLAGYAGVVSAAENGISLGIELDVRQTADEVLVCNHDDEVIHPENETYGTLAIADNWYANMLAELGEGSPPRLIDALEVLSDHVPLIDLDIKERGYVSATVEASLSIPADRLMVSSHIPSVVKEIAAQVRDGVRVGLLINEYWQLGASEMITLSDSVGANVIFVECRHITPSFVEQIHGAGYEVGSYTLNDQIRLHEVIELGLDFPCTDHPHMAIHELSV